MISSLLMLIARGATAQPAPDPLGICAIGNISGRSIVDANGRLLNLTEFCSRQQVPVVVTLEPQDEAFWQTFLSVASPDAVQFSRSIDRQQVIAYAAAVCPILRQGGSLQQVRQVQIQSRLPAAFDAAVNVAAIHTYCPEYQAQIGRR